ncbi:hypothetical protein [Streptomyces europaeiscabiei]|uniref:hypothetical protein n=1 Tax=Streptomyces europaeiscabiei TaxID=146819 RepID=UPI0029A4E556|nr:hypothetical protein [Streptomyces europaeiscabiei]MDX3777768.1 hypothetical protein [Streptomyces europaeiscabiei]
MTTLTTRAGFDAFRDRMCDHFAALPAGLGKRPLHVTQAKLDADAFFTHRLDDDGHHIVYDPRQVRAIKVRVFLGLYAEYTEGRVLDGTRAAYHQADNDASREIWAIVLHEIDRTQDPDGVMNQIVDLFARERSGASRV